jgi:AbiV family abortive infection protein
VDLRAIKAAGRTELAACAFAAARNTQALLHDAEILAGAGSTARAYSLAALAVEECGKAGSLAVLAMLPEAQRMQAPVGRMLEWHQLKQVGGLLMAIVPIDEPGSAAKLAAMPEAEATQILSTLSAPADEADRLKRRGLYVDMDRTGRIREPSEITHAEVACQLERARQAAASVALMFEQEAQDRLANPPAEATELACALVDALIQAGRRARTPEAAAGVIHNAVSKLRDTMAIKHAQSNPCARDAIDKTSAQMGRES